jgi:predicted DNA-binding protein (UPF0251 family)
MSLCLLFGGRCRPVPRPFRRRRISGRPAAPVFKPAGVRLRDLEVQVLALDEFEAIRLADLESCYHELAAEKMRVSRPTFTRILDAAHRKLADALVHGKALRIEGGPVQVQSFRCCREHDTRPDPEISDPQRS